MADGTCPQCGSRRFFVKDTEDPYEVYSFEIAGGEIRFDDSEERPPVGPETEAFCNRCSWHDRLKSIE
jgi:hypothetical protein